MAVSSVCVLRCRTCVAGAYALSVTSLPLIMFAVPHAGGQFSWVEVMNTMRRPQRFPAAITACTAAMTAAYLSVGALGYWSQARPSLFSVAYTLEDPITLYEVASPWPRWASRARHAPGLCMSVHTIQHFCGHPLLLSLQDTPMKHARMQFTS